MRLVLPIFLRPISSFILNSKIKIRVRNWDGYPKEDCIIAQKKREKQRDFNLGQKHSSLWTCSKEIDKPLIHYLTKHILKLCLRYGGRSILKEEKEGSRYRSRSYFVFDSSKVRSDGKLIGRL